MPITEATCPHSYDYHKVIRPVSILPQQVYAPKRVGPDQTGLLKMSREIIDGAQQELFQFVNFPLANKPPSPARVLRFLKLLAWIDGDVQEIEGQRGKTKTLDFDSLCSILGWNPSLVRGKYKAIVREAYQQKNPNLLHAIAIDKKYKFSERMNLDEDAFEDSSEPQLPLFTR